MRNLCICGQLKAKELCRFIKWWILIWFLARFNPATRWRCDWCVFLVSLTMMERPTHECISSIKCFVCVQILTFHAKRLHLWLVWFVGATWEWMHRIYLISACAITWMCQNSDNWSICISTFIRSKLFYISDCREHNRTKIMISVSRCCLKKNFTATNHLIFLISSTSTMFHVNKSQIESAHFCEPFSR